MKEVKKIKQRPQQKQTPPGIQTKMQPRPKVERTPQNFKLSEKVALITGGDSGIGQAVAAFTRSLALSLIGQGIRVNGVAPGPMWTPLIVSTFPPQKKNRNLWVGRSYEKSWGASRSCILFCFSCFG